MTVASVDFSYRETMAKLMSSYSKDLIAKAGAKGTRFGSIGTGEHAGSLLFIQFYDDLNEALLQINQGLQPGRREGSGGHKEEGSGGHKEEGPVKYKEEGSSMGTNPPQNKPKSISPNIMDHIYETPEEAKRISVMLGFGGEIHSHKTPQGTIYMPGPTM